MGAPDFRKEGNIEEGGGKFNVGGEKAGKPSLRDRSSKPNWF
jgi:hypothetical protein